MKRALLAIAAMLVPDASLSAQDGSRQTVEVVASGDPALLEAMADRIRSLESSYPVAVGWTAAAAIDVREIVAPRASASVAVAVFARVWLDLNDPRRAVLFIANAGHDRFLVRVVPASDGYGELTRESLATVVESALDALLAGGQIGVDRGAAVRAIEAQTGTPIAAEPQAPEPAVAAEPAPVRAAPLPSARSTLGPWSLAAQYRADAIASGLTLRHGAQLALGYAAGLGSTVDLLLMLTTQYSPAFSLGDSGRRVEAYGGGARLAVGATSRAGGVFGWQAALGAGADLARVEPAIDADTGLAAAEPFVVTTPIATAYVNFAIRPAPWFDLALGVGVDVALLGQHFDVETGGDRTPLISPWRARPFVVVGASVPFGAGRSR